MGSNSKQELISKWIIKADNDLKIVEIGLDYDILITDVLCFHCQQCAEKYLKAYLIFRNIDFPKTHNLSILLEECKKLEPIFDKLEDIVYLTEYAVELRYPDDFYMPDKEETTMAFQKAKKVKDFVIKRLKLDSDDSDDNKLKNF